LGLSPTSLDQCLLYKRDQSQLQAFVSVQVDDSLAVGDAAYGAAIHQDDCGLKLVQEEHVNKLTFDAEEKSPAKFASVRALGSYVATM
jgi:hypothetical protein